MSVVSFITKWALITHRKGSLVGPRSGVGTMKRETSYTLKGKTPSSSQDSLVIQTTG